MPDDLRALWQRAVANSRRELKRLGKDRCGLDPDADLESLFAARWPNAREAAIEGLAREEAGEDESLFRDVCRRLDRDLPREYPFSVRDEGSDQ